LQCYKDKAADRLIRASQRLQSSLHNHALAAKADECIWGDDKANLQRNRPFKAALQQSKIAASKLMHNLVSNCMHNTKLMCAALFTQSQSASTPLLIKVGEQHFADEHA